MIQIVTKNYRQIQRAAEGLITVYIYNDDATETIYVDAQGFDPYAGIPIAAKGNLNLSFRGDLFIILDLGSAKTNVEAKILKGVPDRTQVLSESVALNGGVLVPGTVYVAPTGDTTTSSGSIITVTPTSSTQSSTPLTSGSSGGTTSRGGIQQ